MHVSRLKQTQGTVASCSGRIPHSSVPLHWCRNTLKAGTVATTAQCPASNQTNVLTHTPATHAGRSKDALTAGSRAGESWFGERPWIWRQQHPGHEESAEQHQHPISLMSWNVLADQYANYHAAKLYKEVPRSCLLWSHRRPLVIAEVLFWSPDVVCLQEVQHFDEIEKELSQAGYAGVFLQRAGRRRDGCATFWRTDRMSHLATHNLKFVDHKLDDNVGLLVALQPLPPPPGAPARPQPGDYDVPGGSSREAEEGGHEGEWRWEESSVDGRILMVPNSRAERSGVQIPHVAPDESALGTEHAESAAQGCSTASGSALPPPIVVANTHVAFDPNKGDVKLGQIRTLFSAAHDLARTWGGLVLVAGDFNTAPTSPLYSYMAQGMLDVTQHCKKKLSGQVKGYGYPQYWQAVRQQQQQGTDQGVSHVPQPSCSTVSTHRVSSLAEAQPAAATAAAVGAVTAGAPSATAATAGTTATEAASSQRSASNQPEALHGHSNTHSKPSATEVAELVLKVLVPEEIQATALAAAAAAASSTARSTASTSGCVAGQCMCDWENWDVPLIVMPAAAPVVPQQQGHSSNAAEQQHEQGQGAEQLLQGHDSAVGRPKIAADRSSAPCLGSGQQGSTGGTRGVVSSAVGGTGSTVGSTTGGTAGQLDALWVAARAQLDAWLGPAANNGWGPKQLRTALGPEAAECVRLRRLSSLQQHASFSFSEYASSVSSISAAVAVGGDPQLQLAPSDTTTQQQPPLVAADNGIPATTQPELKQADVVLNRGGTRMDASSTGDVTAGHSGSSVEPHPYIAPGCGGAPGSSCQGTQRPPATTGSNGARGNAGNPGSDTRSQVATSSRDGAAAGAGAGATTASGLPPPPWFRAMGAGRVGAGEGAVACHPLPLVSSYKEAAGREPRFSSVHHEYLGCCDYLWFTRTPLTHDGCHHTTDTCCDEGSGRGSGAGMGGAGEQHAFHGTDHNRNRAGHGFGQQSVSMSRTGAIERSSVENALGKHGAGDGHACAGGAGADAAGCSEGVRAGAGAYSESTQCDEGTGTAGIGAAAAGARTTGAAAGACSVCEAAAQWRCSCEGVLGPPELSALPHGLPAPHWGSDHIPLLARYTLSRTGTGSS